MGEALMNCGAAVGVRGIVAAVVFGPLLFAACKSGAPSKDELDRLIDERLAERGLAPLPSASGAASASAAVSTAGHKELKKNGVFILHGFAKFVVVKKPARPAREGINPFTKEMQKFAAKPASKGVRARAVKAIKDAVG
jgi:DNA-binding protein HU-beta